MNKKKKLIPELRFTEFVNDGEWKEYELNDFCFNISSGKDKNSETGKFELYGSTGIIGKTDSASYNGNYILIARVGANAGLLNRAKGKFGVTDNTLVLDLRIADSIDFIHYSLEKIGLNKLVFGSGQPLITGGQLKSLKLISPLSEKEQQKIAACLSSLDEVIVAQKQKLALLKDHKKGLLQNLFPQEGAKVPKYRFKEFAKDGDWKKMTLGEISKITSGGTPNRSENQYWNGDIPWITTTLIDFNIINEANEYITEVGLQNSSAKIFPKGTILMAMYGQGKTRGKVGVLGIDAATNQACAAILLKKGYSTDYVFQYLAAHYDEIRELSNKGGQENLSGGLIENIRLSIPNLAEQQKIASCLSSLDGHITAQTEKIEQLKQHKKGMMQGLFPKMND